MRIDPEIEEMGARFHIETSHVRHVAGLALQLFDGFALSGKRRDRLILKTAALLHDIGYASDPENHVDAGVEILLSRPVLSFSDADWRSVAAVVSLHRRCWQPVLQSPLFLGFGKQRQEQLKMLAAVLRIADGLDHGRLQDVSVKACRRGSDSDNVTVQCGWYLKNISWAEGKADLWESVFERPLKLVGICECRTLPFAGVVSGTDRTTDAVRKILYSQFCVMRDNLALMKEADDAEYLHDFRVAMRRFRTGVKLFRPVVQHSGLCSAVKNMGVLSDDVGAIRDIHLKAHYIEKMKPAVDEANVRLKEILTHRNAEVTVRQAGGILRTAFNDTIDFDGDKRFAGYVEKIFNRLMGEINEGGAADIRYDQIRLHELRKKCRHGRYLSEFAAPADVKGAEQAAEYLKAIATALGDIRDIQIILDRRDPDEKLIGSEDALHRQLSALWDTFEMNWKTFSSDFRLT